MTAQGSAQWIADIANELKGDLCGIEIVTTSKVCTLIFVVSQEPTKALRKKLYYPKLSNRPLGIRTVFELRFFFSIQDCPNAAALAMAAHEHFLEIPENVIFPANFFGMYKKGIRPNVNANSFVFKA